MAAVTSAAIAAGAAAYSANKQSSAAKRAARVQQRATEQSLELAQPFVNLGDDNIDAFQALLTPEGQADYLVNNPLLQQAQANITRDLNNRFAASGKSISGGLVDATFRNNALLANDFLNQEFNRRLVPVQIGQNASVGAGSLLTNNANAQGASIIAQGNIAANQANTLSNIFGTAITAA